MKKLLKNTGKILVFFFSWAILGGLIDVPSDNPAIWRFWAEFVPFALIAVISAVFWLLEKKNMTICGFWNAGRNLIWSILVGALWIGIPIAALWLAHVLTFTGSNPVSWLALWLLSCWFNVAMQEILVRGYIYQLLRQEYGIPAAVFVTTALFTLFHAGAFEEGIIPVLCVITMSLAMSAVLEYGQSLIPVMILHGIWNMTGAIIFNVIELADDYPHVLNAVFTGSRYLTGGSCRIEGSLVVLILNLLLTAAFVLLKNFCRRAGDE